MTVCIAAACVFDGKPLVIGASDRMLTAGDIEFEPQQTKVYPLAKNAVIMISGDAGAMLSVARHAWAELHRTPETEDVESVAQIVLRHFQEERRRRAAAEILSPLGLDLDTFLQQQRDLGRDLVLRLVEELRGYQLESNPSSLIVAGTDPSGAHIYVIRDPGILTCSDIVGFAAIGLGDWHARSQFMFAKYLHSWTFDKALRLLYLAKKRAEVAPGVGTYTDLFFIGPHPAQQQAIHPDTVEKLEEIYQQHVTYTQVVGDITDQMVVDYVKQLKEQAERPSAPQVTGGDTTPEPGGISSDPPESQSETQA